MGNNVSSAPNEEETEVLTPLSTPLLTLDFDISPPSLPHASCLSNDTTENNSLRSQDEQQQQQHETTTYSPILYNHIRKKKWTEAKSILNDVDNDIIDKNILYADAKTNHTVLNYTCHHRDIPNDIFQSILTACQKYDNNSIFLSKSRCGGWTPLQWSIAYSTPSHIMSMINACPLASSLTNDDGATPLHIVARAMSTDRWRRTPLKRAIVYNNNSHSRKNKHKSKSSQDATEKEERSRLIRHESLLLTTSYDHDDDDDGIQEIIQALVLAHPSGVTTKDVDGNTPFDIFFENWAHVFIGSGHGDGDDDDDEEEEDVALLLEKEVVNSQVSNQGKKLKWVCDIAALLLGIRGSSSSSNCGGHGEDDISSASHSSRKVVLSLLKLLCKAKLSEQKQQDDGDGLSSSSPPPETLSFPSVISLSSSNNNNNNNTVEFQCLEKYMKKVECHI